MPFIKGSRPGCQVRTACGSGRVLVPEHSLYSASPHPPATAGGSDCSLVHFFRPRTYATSDSICSVVSFFLNAGILPLPFEMELKMRSSVTSDCQRASVRSRACRWCLDLKGLARPSLPWHVAQFLL